MRHLSDVNSWGMLLERSLSITGIKLAQCIIAIEALRRGTCVKLLTVVSCDSAEDSSRSSVQESSKRVIKRTMDGQLKANARMEW